MPLLNVMVDFKDLAAAIREMTAELRMLRMYFIPEAPADLAEPRKTTVSRLDPHAEWEREAKLARERGENPDDWAWQPPRVRRD